MNPGRQFERRKKNSHVFDIDNRRADALYWSILDISLNINGNVNIADYYRYDLSLIDGFLESFKHSIEMNRAQPKKEIR